jgi:hypothetical protein
MAPGLDDILDAFRNQVTTLIDQVAQIDNEVFRKALYVSMIDALSACAYDGMRPGDRFMRFVLEIGNWMDGQRVSLPQAALFFQGDAAMLTAIEALLANWQWGQTHSITSDPFPNELPIRQTVSKVQHLNLPLAISQLHPPLLQ